jgi:FdhE protein
MRTLARDHGLNLQVLWLIAEVVSAPVMHVRQHRVLDESGESVREAIAAWQRGTCPACGAWPVVAEFFYGERLNRCSYCASTWPVAPGTCTYCGETGEAFQTIVPDRERPGRRLELCRTCGGYLKTIDVGRSTPFPLLAVEDFATNDLDRAAQHHGFRRTRQ